MSISARVWNEAQVGPHFLNGHENGQRVMTPLLLSSF
jgi:hypothetical protein